MRKKPTKIYLTFVIEKKERGSQSEKVRERQTDRKTKSNFKLQCSVYSSEGKYELKIWKFAGNKDNTKRRIKDKEKKAQSNFVLNWRRLSVYCVLCTGVYYLKENTSGIIMRQKLGRIYSNHSNSGKCTVLILDGTTEHVAHAWRTIGLFEKKNPSFNCSRSNQMP